MQLLLQQKQRLHLKEQPMVNKKQQGSALIFLLIIILVAAVIIVAAYLWKKGHSMAQNSTQDQSELTTANQAIPAVADPQTVQNLDIGNTDSDLSNIDQQLKGL